MSDLTRKVCCRCREGLAAAAGAVRVQERAGLQALALRCRGGVCAADATDSAGFKVPSPPLTKPFLGTSCLIIHLADIAVTFGLQKAAKKQDYLICGLEDIGSMHSVLEAAGQSTRDVQSHLLTSSLSRAGHSGGRGWMQRGSKQQAGKVHHRKGPPRMMQPTCWEKACGSATQSCGTPDSGSRHCTAMDAANSGMTCA